MNKVENITSSPDSGNTNVVCRRRNIKIADFMEVDELIKYGFDTNGNSFLNYEKSWNALMPVIGKIGEIENQADIDFAKELDEFKKSKTVTIFNVSIFAPIEFVYECVWDFVEWYVSQ